MKQLTAAFAVLFAALSGLGGCSGAPPTECDVLARSPVEPGSNGRGVLTRNIKYQAALDACTALKDVPGDQPATYFRLARLFFHHSREINNKSELESARAAAVRADELGHPLGAYVAGQAYLTSVTGLPADPAIGFRHLAKARETLSKLAKDNVVEAKFLLASMSLRDGSGSYRDIEDLERSGILRMLRDVSAANPALNDHVRDLADDMWARGDCDLQLGTRPARGNVNYERKVSAQALCAEIYHTVANDGSAEASFLAINAELPLADQVFQLSRDGNLDSYGAEMMDDMKKHLDAYRVKFPNERAGLGYLDMFKAWDAKIKGQRQQKERREAFLAGVVGFLFSGKDSAASGSYDYDRETARMRQDQQKMLDCQAKGDSAMFPGSDDDFNSAAMDFAWSGC